MFLLTAFTTCLLLSFFAGVNASACVCEWRAYTKPEGGSGRPLFNEARTHARTAESAKNLYALQGELPLSLFHVRLRVLEALVLLGRKCCVRCANDRTAPERRAWREDKAYEEKKKKPVCAIGR